MGLSCRLSYVELSHQCCLWRKNPFVILCFVRWPVWSEVNSHILVCLFNLYCGYEHIFGLLLWLCARYKAFFSTRVEVRLSPRERMTLRAVPLEMGSWVTFNLIKIGLPVLELIHAYNGKRSRLNTLLSNDDCLLGYSAVYSCRNWPPFQRC
jgi:hypothetical protein